MKIAFDVREITSNKTGKGVYTENLLKEMIKQAPRNIYYLYSNKFFKFPKRQKVEKRIIKKRGIFWHIASYRQMIKDKIDVFVSTVSYIIPAILNPKKLKTVLVIHDLISFLFPRTHNKKAVIIERATLKKAVKNAVKIVCVSKSTKKDLENIFSSVKGKTTVIYEGVNKLQIADCRLQIEKKKNYILFVGTLSPRKNLDALIEAYAMLDERLRKRYKLVIAGSKGWQYKNIFKKIKKLGIEKNVDFKGYLADNIILDLYKSATLFVFPSLYEGFGLPILEAFSAGTPVITSNTSSLPEIADNAAIQVDPTDPENLSKTIEKVLGDKKLQERMIEKGLKQAKKFSWEKTSGKLLKLLKC